MRRLEKRLTVHMPGFFCSGKGGRGVRLRTPIQTPAAEKRGVPYLGGNHEDRTGSDVVLVEEEQGRGEMSARRVGRPQPRTLIKRTGMTQQTVRLFSAVPLTFSTWSYTCGTQPSSEAEEAIDIVLN